MNKYCCLVVLLVVLTGNAQDIPDGPYFGQDVPGKTPVVFAPGIISTQDGSEGTVTFSPDGKEIFFGRDKSIYWMQEIDGHWTQPTIPAFLVGHKVLRSPRLSPDGQTLAFMADIFWVDARTYIPDRNETLSIRGTAIR
ncbi:TolB family protein [Planctomycetota bacterium]